MICEKQFEQWLENSAKLEVVIIIDLKKSIYWNLLLTDVRLLEIITQKNMIPIVLRMIGMNYMWKVEEWGEIHIHLGLQKVEHFLSYGEGTRYSLQEVIFNTKC